MEKNSACQKPRKKNRNNNWKTKETISSEAKSDVKEWEKAIKISKEIIDSKAKSDIKELEKAVKLSSRVT